MERLLTQRVTTLTGLAMLLVTLTVCGLGIRLTQLQYRNMSGVLLDIEKRSAESALGRIEADLEEVERRILTAIQETGTGASSLAAMAAREPLVKEPFLFSQDGVLVCPALGRAPGRMGPQGEDSPPPELEKAMRTLWKQAPAAEKIEALKIAEKSAAAGIWRLRASALSLALESRTGRTREAAAGYQALFQEHASSLLEGSAPSFLQLTLARLECLTAAGETVAAREVLADALNKLKSGDLSPVFVEEQFFLVRARDILARTGGHSLPLFLEMEARHQDKKLFLSLAETLRNYIFARGYFEAAVEDDARPHHFFEERSASGNHEPTLLVWMRPAESSSSSGSGVAGFQVDIRALESMLELSAGRASPGPPLLVKALPGPESSGFIDLARPRGELSFLRIGLERNEWERKLSKARMPFLFAGALIAVLMALLVLGLIAFLRGVRKEMALSRMKTEFVANVSHELKTPLALIRLFGETLLLGRGDPQSREKYCRIITRESERLTHLISSVLSFASIEAGKKCYDLKPCDATQTVRDTYETYRFHLDEKGFAHTLECSDGRHSILADANAVSEALINLLENAVKYSRDSKQIDLKVLSVNGAVEVSVADRGVGIPSEDQGKVFEDYYRTKEARAMGTRGSGLGLSLVQHIMKAHGGEVKLSSQPGVGSVFTLVFPILKDMK